MTHPGNTLWYVRSRSRSKEEVRGPFDTVQVRELIKSGQIGLEDQIGTTSETENPVVPEQWKLLKEIPEFHALCQEGPAAKVFHPPPRPAALQTQDETARHPLFSSNEEFEQTNPTLTLFNTLQAAKDRKTTRPTEALQSPELHTSGKPAPPRRWFVLAAAAIAVSAFAAWGLSRSGSNKPAAGQSASSTQAETPSTPPPPARATRDTAPRKIPPSAALPRNRPISPPPVAAPRISGDTERRRPPVVREVEREPIPSEFENRGSFDDPMMDDLEMDASDHSFGEVSEELARPPHVSLPRDAGGLDADMDTDNDEMDANGDGAAFPPPVFD